MDDKQKQEAIAALEQRLAALEESLASLYAELDRMVEQSPDLIFEMYATDPQKAIECAGRLGWDWFLNTH